MRRGLPFLASVLILSGCSGTPYGEVSRRSPHLEGPPGGGPFAAIERTLTKATHEEKAQPLEGLGDCLVALQAAELEVEKHPNDSLAVRDYNFGISRIFQIIHDGRLDPWSNPLTVPTASGNYTLTHHYDSRPEWDARHFDFTPADEFDVGGKYVTERTLRPGIGAPIVAVERENSNLQKEKFAPSRIFYSVTVTAHFEGKRCFLVFEDPLAKEEILFRGKMMPLAADFTVPLAVMLEATDPAKHELSRVLNPEKYADTAAIERLQPYDPNKTVVLVIHGLSDSQATWTPMINKLRGDKFIRQHYQFWFYSYPTGYPFPYMAAILRQELDRVERAFPKMKPMVLIGHSMGGCISRLMLTDSGDKLCREIFGRPLDEVPLSPQVRDYFRQELFFKHRPEVGRVIFIASPLRGSSIATGIMGSLANLFIRESSISSQASKEMIRQTSDREEELRPKSRSNSVESLNPKSRFLHAMNDIPMTPGVPYNTIIGDRGKGDSPNSSDGVVPYWSSHMKGAESEDIVPSNHTAHQNPQAIAEVMRILKAHAD